MKKVEVFWSTLLFFLLGSVLSQLYPEHIHISYGDDPSTMHVAWSTRSDPGDSVVEFGLTVDGSPELSVQATTYQLVPGILPNTKQFVHKANLQDLTPNTTYWYRCGSHSHSSWGKTLTFLTMPEGSDWAPRLAIFGDLGAINHKILNRLIDDARRDRIDAVLHTGDIAYDLHSDGGRVGDLFMQQIEPVASKIPYMVAPGNHEAFRNFTNYRTRFHMPGGFSNMMYSFRMGPLLAIAISTEAYYLMENGGRDAVTKQNAWLTQVLKEANLNRREVPWVIVFGHRPMYCSNNILRSCATGNTRVRDPNRPLRGKGLEAILYDNGVDAVFWGHQHSYERMFPVYKKKILKGSETSPYNNPRAPVHFIAGCAGNNEAVHNFLANPPAWSAFRSISYGYIHMTVTNKSHLRIQYLPHDIDGSALDEIWIEKNAHGPYPFMFPHNMNREEENKVESADAD